MAFQNRSMDIDAEMSRFEQEIASAATYSAPPVPSNSSASTYKPPSMHFIPHQIKRSQTNHHQHQMTTNRAPNISPAMPSSTLAASSNFLSHAPMINPNVANVGSFVPTSSPVLPSPHSMIASNNPSLAHPPTFPVPNYTLTPMGMPSQIHTVPPMNSMPSSLSGGQANGATNASGANSTDAKKKGGKSNEKGKKPKKYIRAAGGTTWEDPTLQEWESDDFRIFCGDLGNDVNNEILSRAFNKYPSFLKAKVVRDKRTNKTKGYGFVSFKDPTDFIRAMREMNGKYVGSRPIKLRKSCWKDRSLEVAKKKAKEKQKLGLL